MGETALCEADLETVLCALLMEDQGDGSKTTMLELWPTDMPYNNVIGNSRKFNNED